jgi:nitrate/nitrite-specific signal transduction histidine kinase
MLKPSSTPFIRNFTIAYVTALTLIGGLIASSTVLLAISITEQIGDAAVINISGKQRMLSQRIAQFAQRRVQEGSTEAAKSLEGLAQQMLADHEALINGDPDLGVMSPAPPLSPDVLF